MQSIESVRVGEPQHPLLDHTNMQFALLPAQPPGLRIVSGRRAACCFDEMGQQSIHQTGRSYMATLCLRVMPKASVEARLGVFSPPIQVVDKER